MKDRLKIGMISPDFTFDSPWEKSLRFDDFLKNDKLMLVFLRYFGCPLCQLKISELIGNLDQFKQAGVKVLVILQSDPSTIRGVVEEKDMPLTIVCDADEKIFTLFKVFPGSIFRYITPGVLAKAMKAKKEGFVHGKNEGKELQLPAVFLIDKDKTIKYAYYGKNVGDVPDSESLLDIAAEY